MTGVFLDLSQRWIPEAIALRQLVALWRYALWNRSGQGIGGGSSGDYDRFLSRSSLYGRRSG